MVERYTSRGQHDPEGPWVRYDDYYRAKKLCLIATSLLKHMPLMDTKSSYAQTVQAVISEVEKLNQKNKGE